MRAFKTSAVYVCAILGAGFATGKELMEYFGIYGLWGIAGIGIASFLFALTAYRVIRHGVKENKLINIVSTIFLIVLYSAMLSASGEIFKMFNLPFATGVAAMGALSFLSVLDSGHTIERASMILFPVIVICCIITGVYILKDNNTPVQKEFSPKIILSALLYTAYNIITAVNILAYEKDKGIAFKTAVISGLSIFLLAAVLTLPIICCLDYVQYSSLPLMKLLPQNSAVFYAYIIMLLSAVYTTAVTNAISAVRQTGFSPAILTLLAAVFAFVGFGTIVTRVYFVFGIAGVVILLNIFRN